MVTAKKISKLCCDENPLNGEKPEHTPLIGERRDAMTGDPERVETVIIGGGHAGLTMSYFLSQAGREHVILERGRVGERWRSERWDSFCFQFPNWTIELPGYNIARRPDARRVRSRAISRPCAVIKPNAVWNEVKSLSKPVGRYLLTTNSGTLKLPM
jgi:glycine/D-amino acid oxidase-like deaminating enzyme